jgi:hypothetical protein
MREAADLPNQVLRVAFGISAFFGLSGLRPREGPSGLFADLAGVSDECPMYATIAPFL